MFLNTTIILKLHLKVQIILVFFEKDWYKLLCFVLMKLLRDFNWYINFIFENYYLLLMDYLLKKN